MTNYEIAAQFTLLAKLMDIHGGNPFKIKSYANAAFALDRINEPIESMQMESIAKLRGIGAALAENIKEILTTKRLSVLEDYIERTPPGILEMMKIKGLGPKKIATIWKSLEIETIGELLYACEENRLVNYKGFGAKTQASIQESLNYYLQHQGHFLYQQVALLVDPILAATQKQFPKNKHAITGAYLRQMETLDFLDLVSTISETELRAWLEEKGFEIITEKEYVRCIGPDHVELRWHLCQEPAFELKVFSLSCSQSFWDAWQQLPKFNQLISFENEAALFEQVNISYIPPAQREDAAILQIAATKALPKTIVESDIRGIVHAHSNWSDGLDTIEAMALAAKSKGLEYLVLSDHSKSAFYANGLKEDRIKAQHLEIDQLNKKLAPFVIFKSIESDILYDGSLDYEPEILALFDLVIASVHTNLKMTEEKAMSRLLRAIENPYTNILGHPTGRLLLSRKGYPVNHDLLIKACVENKVVIELNAHPRRLDMDWRYIRSAVEKEVLISINPDAHAIDGFEDCKYGVLVAQKAGLTAAQNLSSFTLNEMMEFISYQHAKRD